MTLKNANLPMLIERFHDDEACRRILEDIRWPEGVACIQCGSLNVKPVKNRPSYACNDCAYQFSVMVGTVLQDTKIPLWKWFLATYFICESRKGISSNQMKRMIGITYKSAWFLTHRIRYAMAMATPALLSGTVEVDETYVGGKARGKGRGYRDNKSMVIGAIERGGAVRFRVDQRNDRKTLHGFIKSVVDDDAVAIYTDQWAAYRGIGDENTIHESVNHQIEEWVRGDVHTQGIESVWSLLKRSIVGSYHQLSAKHLDSYLDELEWRFNNRDNPYLFRDTLAALLSAESLEYKELIAS